jgi:hypothetical protein
MLRKSLIGPAVLFAVVALALASVALAQVAHAQIRNDTGVLPVVRCPTTWPVTTPPQYSLPQSIQTSASASIVARLAFYANDRLMVLAPRGWVCRGEDAVDGGGMMSVFPQGEDPFGAYAIAVTAFTDGACQGCIASTVCGLFPHAPAILGYSNVPMPCNRAARESTYRLNSTAVAFEDRSFVKGTGNPSGGVYAANGVMIFDVGRVGGSDATETCTLPDADHALCTVILNAFLQRWHR